MIIPEDIFRNAVPYDEPYNLANIQDVNTLMAKSQELSKPVYEITEREYGTGAQWFHMQNGREVGAKIVVSEVDKVYTDMANAIIKMI
jgi:hypothetical protein